jgi:ubiquinone/menaquinone biosynthesis C-methylase UbiE
MKKRLASEEEPLYIYNWMNPVGLYMHQYVSRCLLSMLNRHGVFLQGRRILDLGCGYGGWTRFFAELRRSSEDLVGIDVTPHRIYKARRVNPAPHLVVGDALSLPFRNETFDVVAAFDIFEHIGEAPEEASREVYRVLKPKGLLIWFDLSPFPSSSDLIRGYSLKEVCSLFPRFKLLEYRHIFKGLRLGGLFKFNSYHLSRKSFILAELMEKLPVKGNNLLALMRKTS